MARPPEKLDTASHSKIAPLSQVNAILVNGDALQAAVARHQELGIKVIRA